MNKLVNLDILWNRLIFLNNNLCKRAIKLISAPAQNKKSSLYDKIHRE